MGNERGGGQTQGTGSCRILTGTAFLRVASLSLLQQTLSVTLDPDHGGCGGRPGEAEAQALCSLFRRFLRKPKGAKHRKSDGECAWIGRSHAKYSSFVKRLMNFI